MVYRRRRGLRKPRRRPGLRWRKRFNRRVAGQIHAVKRLGAEIIIANRPSVNDPTLYVPTVVQDGGIVGLPSFVQGAITAGVLQGTYDFTLSSQFFLSALEQLSDMTNFFDRYKITGVALKMHYLQNSASPQGVANLTSPIYNNLPTLYYAFDGDDASVNTITQIQQKGYCKSKVLNANLPAQVYLRPRISKTIAGPITPGTSSEKPCWLDCNSASLPHFGMKFAITDWVGGQVNNALRIQPVYYVKFRDTN